MLGRNAAAVLFGQHAPLGDAQQGVVRLVHRLGGEHTVVCCDERQVLHVRERDQAGFDGAVDVQAVAVQLHHGAAGEGFQHHGEQAFGVGFLPLRQQAPDRAGGAAGQQKQAGRACGDAVPGLLRLEARVGVEEPLARQFLQIGKAHRVLRQQHDRVRGEACIVGPGQRDLAADDRLDAFANTVLRKLQRPKQVAGIGDRHRRHARVLRQSGELVDADGALGQGVGGVGAEVDEVCVGHSPSLRG